MQIGFYLISLFVIHFRPFTTIKKSCKKIGTNEKNYHKMNLFAQKLLRMQKIYFINTTLFVFRKFHIFSCIYSIIISSILCIIVSCNCSNNILNCTYYIAVFSAIPRHSQTRAKNGGFGDIIFRWKSKKKHEWKCLIESTCLVTFASCPKKVNKKKYFVVH